MHGKPWLGHLLLGLIAAGMLAGLAMVLSGWAPESGNRLVLIGFVLVWALTVLIMLALWWRER